MIKAILDFIFKVMVLGVLFAIWSHYADASPYTDDDVVIATIILEAGGEYHVGALEGVYEVIMTRADKRKMTPAEVCLQKWQFSCWNGMVIEDQIAKAKKHPRWKIAKNILGKDTNYVKGADHYHADYIDKPYWAKSMKVTTKIGKHIFYR
jgi:spore germination cell wall hydrolase CwlJ-like protein